MARLTVRTVKRYGWIPDLPDQRDLRYAAPRVPAGLPARVDLRPRMPPVYDQGELGSCTANAIGAAVQYARELERLRPAFVPSRLFVYYNERVIEGTVAEDSGAMLRDGMKAIAKLGVSTEDEPRKAWNWPYQPARFAERPPRAAFAFGLRNQAVVYRRIQQAASQMKGCLAEGYPFVFGFTVYQSFESATVARSGVVPMPGPREKAVGGHAVVAVGYDDSSQRFLVRNSWGVGWGKKGYCTMPYAYLGDSDLADDLWTVRTMEADDPGGRAAARRRRTSRYSSGATSR
jgi:C1A family cysteine protease